MKLWSAKNILKVLSTIIIALSFNMTVISSSYAILCGVVKCDTTKRQCVKLEKSICIEWGTTVCYGGYGGCSTPCLKYSQYQCIGKNETAPEKSTSVTSSVDNSGNALSGEAESAAIMTAAEAEYTNFEKNEIVENTYAAMEKVTFDTNAKSVLDSKLTTKTPEQYKQLLQEIVNDEKSDYRDLAQIALNNWDDNKDSLTEDYNKFVAEKKGDILEEIATLENYTTKEGYSDGMGSPRDTRILDKLQSVKDKLEDLYKRHIITADEYKQLLTEATRLADTALQRVVEAANNSHDTAKVNKAQEEIANVIEEGSLQECPTYAQLKARYESGCWTCLVMGYLTSSFLEAADKGLKLTKRAGMTLLWLGTAIWLVFWALKNVSSFTEIQTGNILNELIKFFFKIAIAYWFIVYSSTLISKYFIAPMMSVGAQIAQSFWSPEVKEYTKDWDDTEGVEDLQTVVDEARKENAEEIKQNQETTLVTTPEEQELLNQAKQLEIHESEKSDIPFFITPGVEGRINSYPGCRKPFRTSNGKMGSKSHMGLDVGGGNNMKAIKAITGGTITYSGKAATGWGLKATITTKHKGNTWIHLYGHMNPKTYADFKKKLNGREVVIGQQIGSVGTTGNSTGPHLHLEVQLTGKVGQYNYKQTYLDPISLGQGKIVPRAYKYTESTKTFTFEKSRCDGTFVDPEPNTGYRKGSTVPPAGFSSTGKAGLDLSDTYVYEGSGSGGGGNASYDSLVVSIPEVDFKYPTNIMPKSVMDSILGATRAITNTTSGVMILGNSIMCYASAKHGGAWHIHGLVGIIDFYITNFFMWLGGGIVYCLGFMLTLSVAYYLVDISFKIGFAVLAIPLVMGLWPFGITQGKLYIAISIIAKSSATFAFLALTTAYGMLLVSEAVGGLEELYEAMEKAMDISTDDDEAKELRRMVSSRIFLFSTTFVILTFAILYFYKLLRQTISDLVNKFFPDQAFGDSSPMHSAATMMTSWAKNMAMKVSGLDLAKDIVANQVGVLAKKGTAATAKLAGKGAVGLGKGVGKAAGGAGKAIANSKAGQAVGRAAGSAGRAIANSKVGQAVGNAGKAVGNKASAAGKAIANSKITKGAGKIAKGIGKYIKNS